MVPFRLTPQAKADILDIAAYTEKHWGVQQRYSYIKRLDTCFHRLALSPTIGKLRPELFHDLRSFPEGQHVIYYMVKSKVLVIVNILHKRMEPTMHLVPEREKESMH